MQSLAINQANDTGAACEQDSLVFTSQNSSAGDNHVPHFRLQITVMAHKAAADSTSEHPNSNGNDAGSGDGVWQDAVHLQCRAHTKFSGKQRKQRIKAF